MAKKVADTSAPIEAPAAAPHGPVLPKHFAWLPVPEYEGLEVRCWTNAPQRVFLDLVSDDLPRIQSAIHALLVGTRTTVEGGTFETWFDCDGEPLPPASDEGFFEAVPTELLAMAMLAIRQDSGSALRNLVQERRTRSRSG